MGDSAKVLEKKSLFFSRFKGSPGGGPWVGKNEVFLQAEPKLWLSLGLRPSRKPQVLVLPAKKLGFFLPRGPLSKLFFFNI